MDYKKVDDSGRRGRYSVATEYRNSLPEAKDLSWNDDFFEDDDDAGVGIVAVFDFDYEKIVSFRTQYTYARQLSIVYLCTAYIYLSIDEGDEIFALLPTALYILSLAPILVKFQVRWEAYAQHVVVTRDGIRYVRDKRRSCWGFSICDRGKHSKTVPFDKITDCDIVEPAGNSCLCIPNILMDVHVDTASSGSDGKPHELVLSGLKDAHGFKKLVWAMKRAKEAGGGPFGYYQAPTETLSSSHQQQQFNKSIEMANMAMEGGTHNNIQCTDLDSKEIKGILHEIRDELRENNQLLRQQARTQKGGNGYNKTTDIV